MTSLSISLVSLLCAIVAAFVSTCMYVRLRAEFRTLSLRAVSGDELTENNGALAERFSDLESRLQSTEESRADRSEWVSQAESLNLNRRGQVLRLHRRGDSVAEIASALRVGQGEVKLMIKVHEICHNPDSWQKTVASAGKGR